MPVPTIQEQFGQIDIYLFDQLLKCRISPGMRILDAGCGSGRNLVYFLREGYEVYAVDPDVQAVESVRALHRLHVWVNGVNFVPFPQKVNQVSTGTASGVQDSHSG